MIGPVVMATDGPTSLRGASSSRDAVAGCVRVRVLEHVAGALAGEDGQHEVGVLTDIAYFDPGSSVGGRPPQADLDAGAAPAMQLTRKG